MKIKIVLFIAAFLAICGSASAQGIRVALSVTQQNTVAGVTNVVTIPVTATIAFCSAPANGVPCTNKATTYTDSTLVTPCSTSTQIVLDGTNTCVAQLNSQATGGVWVSAGQYAYTITYGGANFGPFFVTAGSTSALAGTIATNQVAFGGTSNTVAGSNNFEYVPTSGGVLITTSTVGPTNVAGAGIAIVNSGGGTTAYIGKNSDGTFYISNDSAASPAHGFFSWDGSGNAHLYGASNSANLGLWVSYPSGTTGAGQGTATLSINNTGIGPHVFAVQNATITPDLGAIWQDPIAGETQYNGTASGSARVGVGAAAGTPNPLHWPTATGTAGQRLQTDGNSPQQTSWATTGVQCGTLAANGACANTLTAAEHCISGQATLAAGASTITGISPAFTSSSSYTVITNDNTTIANPSKGVPASASSITFTGTGTDTLNFIACGG